MLQKWPSLEKSGTQRKKCALSLALFFASSLLFTSFAISGACAQASNSINPDYTRVAIRVIKRVAVRVIKRGTHWFRALDTGTLVVRSFKEAQMLGLTNIETAEHIITVIAYDTWQDVEDISTAVRYVAVDIAYLQSVRVLDYVRDTAIPEASRLASEAYEYSRDTIILEASRMVSEGYEYTTDSIVPSVSGYLSNKVNDISDWSSDAWQRWNN